MRRLLFLVALAAIAWYGWNHLGDLRRAPANEVVIRNDSGRAIERVRLAIGGRDYPAHDSIADGDRVTQGFPLASQDGTFRLRWVAAGKEILQEWSGGQVTAGPVPMRHVLQLTPDGGVVWSCTRIAPKGK